MSSDSGVYIYLNDMNAGSPQNAQCYTGFHSTQDMLAWLDAIDHTVYPGWSTDCYLGGKFEVNDAGGIDDFDGHEVSAGTTWEAFKREHAESMEGLEDDRRSWAQEIAREEGMLNGIDSYNDWMGN